MRKFTSFIGPWINSNGVAVYQDSDGQKLFRAETASGKNLSGYIPVDQSVIDQITEDPCNTAQHTVDALRRCGVNIS